MTITAQLADGTTLQFPDGTDPAVIQATVMRMIQQEQPQLSPRQLGQQQAQEQLAQETGVLESLAVSTGRGITDIGRALGLAD